MAQAGQPGPPQQHPFTQHMEWVLVPITKIIRCGVELSRAWSTVTLH